MKKRILTLVLIFSMIMGNTSVSADNISENNQYSQGNIEKYPNDSVENNPDDTVDDVDDKEVIPNLEQDISVQEIPVYQNKNEQDDDQIAGEVKKEDLSTAEKNNDSAAMNLILQSENVVIETGDCGVTSQYTLYDTTSDGNPNYIEITGSGPMYDFDFMKQPWNSYSQYITKAAINEGITRIGAHSFSYQFNKLVDVTLPSTLCEIGDSAFTNCGFEQINLPDSLNSIGNFAFSGSRLSSIDIPSSLTELSLGIFQHCPLETVFIPENITSIGSSAFVGTCVTSISIPKSVTNIGSYAFLGCNNLKSIILPDSIRSLDSYIFSGCTSLKSVVLPANIDTIPQGLFNDCSALSYLSMPDKVRSWGYEAFSGCLNLNMIFLNNACIESIYSNAFNSTESTINIYFTDKSQVSSVIGKNYGGNLNWIQECQAHVWSPDRVVIFKGSCLDEQTTGFVCSDCGMFQENSIETIDAPGHQWNTYYTIDNQSTCITKGTESIHCSVCDEKKDFSEREVALADHSWNTEYTIDKQSTCISEGTKSIHCSVCNIQKKDSEVNVPLNEHKWNSYYSIDKQSTCIIHGIQSIHCTICDVVKDGSEEEAPLVNHTWSANDEYTVDLEPTCSKSGKKSIHCRICDQIIGSTITNIPCIPHTWSEEYTIDELPTCSTLGKKSIHCIKCDAMNSDSQVSIGLTNHEYEASILVSGTETTKGTLQYACSTCEKKYSIYYYANEREASIAGCSSECTNLSIPQTIEGKKVVSISNGAFSYNHNIISVSLPNEIIKIGSRAFDSCDKLQNINFPNGLQEIGSYAFENCTNLANVKFSPRMNSIGASAFSGCRSLISVALPEKLEEISVSLFKNCTNLSEVYIPYGINRICGEAFLGCSNLTTITIPNSVTWIGANAFGMYYSNVSLKYESITEFIAVCDSYPATTYCQQNGIRYSELPHYFLQYVLDGGINHPDNPEIYKTCNARIVLNTPLKEGYTFDGWYTDSSFTNCISEIPTNANQDYVLYAKWIENPLPTPEAYHLYGYQVVLNGNFDLKYYIEMTDELLNRDDLIMKYRIGETYYESPCIRKAGNYQIFMCELGAAQIADNITAELVYDGESHLVSTYSVRDYLNTLIQNPEGKAEYYEAQELAEALLTYSAYAQQYFDYNSEDLANSLLDSDAVAELLDSDVAGNISAEIDDQLQTEDFSYYGASLICESDTYLRVYFNNINDLTLEEIQEKYDIYITGISNPLYEIGMKGNLFYITIKDIPAAELDSRFTIYLNTEERNSYIVYSPVIYIRSALESESVSQELKNMCKALWLYNQAANAYYERYCL